MTFLYHIIMISIYLYLQSLVRKRLIRRILPSSSLQPIRDVQICRKHTEKYDTKCLVQKKALSFFVLNFLGILEFHYATGPVMERDIYCFSQQPFQIGITIYLHLPSPPLAIPTSIFTSYHCLSSYQLPGLMHLYAIV